MTALYLYFCRVLGQVSCELVSPKLNRATEGILFFNLELSQMAAPAFEPGRYLDFLSSFSHSKLLLMLRVVVHDISSFLFPKAVRSPGEAESTLGKVSKKFKVYRY